VDTVDRVGRTATVKTNAKIAQPCVQNEFTIVLLYSRAMPAAAANIPHPALFVLPSDAAAAFIVIGKPGLPIHCRLKKEA